MSTYGRGNPEVERVIAEMNALNAAIQASDPRLAREAQGMVRAVEATWPEPRTVSDYAIRTAMARITGNPLPTGEPERTTGEATIWAVRAFELIGLAWLAWTRNDPQRARFWIGRWSIEGEDKTKLDSEGAIQAFAVALWANAIEALIDNRTDDARRFFRRVFDVGSSFGTESHPTVLWTMAGSFFTLGG
jgi:hypothetical protein